jgi:hypothetical protein
MSKRNELRDNIYQRMHGFKTVKRGYRKDGQSKWYYIDPRGAHSVEDMKEIDVPSENAPNPKLNDILADDMQKNPQDYYIWRTKKDDKVRSAHAEREGEIFNWHVPPTGGHPGEDYNCRCWAEPYKPEKYKNKPVIVDVSGLDMFKELQKTLKPVDLNNKNFPQYAVNDKANVATDVLYFKNMLSDEELLELMANNLLETEKMKNYIYLDKFGHITSGVGALLDDEKAFKSVPWKIGNRLATEAEVDAAYRYFVAKRFEKDDKGEFKNHNRLAESFENECALRVSKEYMVQRMMTHLREDLYRARKKRNDFDTYPIPLKLIILDFYYNKGSFYNQPGLPQALDAKDAKLFREKMMRNMADRDKWTKEQFNLIPRNFWNAY